MSIVSAGPKKIQYITNKVVISGKEYVGKTCAMGADKNRMFKEKIRGQICPLNNLVTEQRKCEDIWS